MRQDGHTPVETSGILVSLSWKADVFRDEAEERASLSKVDTLTLEQSVDRFREDLEARGLDASPPSAPIGDPQWMERLHAAYLEQPSVFE